MSIRIKQPQVARAARYKPGLLLTALIAVSSPLAPLFAPQQAQAWSGNVEICSESRGFNFEWKEKWRDNANKHRLLDPETFNGGVIMYAYDFFNNQSGVSGADGIEDTVIVEFGDAVTFNQNTINGQRQADISITGTLYQADNGQHPSARGFQITHNEASTLYNDSILLEPNMSTGTRNITSPSCIYFARNAIYPTSYTGRIYPTDVPGQNTACSGFDVGCYVNKGFEGVKNTILDVMKAFGSLIAGFFIPDGNSISSIFSDMINSVKETLGFLAYPFEFIYDFFDEMGSGQPWCSETSCTKNFGNFFGSDFRINFSQHGVNSALWITALAIIRGAWSVFLIMALLARFRGVTRQ